MYIDYHGPPKFEALLRSIAVEIPHQPFTRTGIPKVTFGLWPLHGETAEEQDFAGVDGDLHYLETATSLMMSGGKPDDELLGEILRLTERLSLGTDREATYATVSDIICLDGIMFAQRYFLPEETIPEEVPEADFQTHLIHELVHWAMGDCAYNERIREATQTMLSTERAYGQGVPLEQSLPLAYGRLEALGYTVPVVPPTEEGIGQLCTSIMDAHTQLLDRLGLNILNEAVAYSTAGGKENFSQFLVDDIHEGKWDGALDLYERVDTMMERMGAVGAIKIAKRVLDMSLENNRPVYDILP